jgi:6-phosphogluconolactonase
VNGELRVVDDVPGAFAAEVADAFSTAPGDTFGLALSGGETARRCYDRLARQPGIDWSAVTVYWGDERCVPADSLEVNARLAHETLLACVSPGAVHPMRCEDGPDAYAEILASAPSLDLVHLGIGPDGHTASLFASSAALDAPAGQLVALSEDPSGRNPFRRLTLTLAGIARFALAVVTVEGSEKRDALARVRAGDPTVPASLIRAQRVLWLADPAAAGCREEDK